MGCHQTLSQCILCSVQGCSKNTFISLQPTMNLNTVVGDNINIIKTTFLFQFLLLTRRWHWFTFFQSTLCPIILNSELSDDFPLVFDLRGNFCDCRCCIYCLNANFKMWSANYVSSKLTKISSYLIKSKFSWNKYRNTKTFVKPL